MYSQKLATLGLKFGYVKCHLIGDGYKGIAGEGAHAGLFSQLRLFKRSNLQLELVYSLKGCSSASGIRHRKLLSYGNTYFELLHYFETPLLLQYHYKSLFFETGPSIGILIKEFAYEGPSKLINYFQMPANPFDLSLNIGIGYQSDKRLGCGMRYNHSFVPIRKQPTFQYNSSLLFILFYRIIATN